MTDPQTRLERIQGHVRLPSVVAGVATAGATCSTTWAPLVRWRRTTGMVSPSGVCSSV